MTLSLAEVPILSAQTPGSEVASNVKNPRNWDLNRQERQGNKTKIGAIL
jgi:hypothetical protein